jgi:shikimate dehydrogenase
MAAGKSLIRLAILGYPVAHSMSPLIHPQFGLQFGLEIDYQRIESNANDFPRQLRELAGQGLRGCNITVPLKAVACAAATELSAAAEQAGAVNTLVFRSANDWYGTNTDGAGFMRDVLRLLPGGLAGKRILLVGAGGAASGVIAPLLQQLPASLLVANRNLARAGELVRRFAALGPVSACAFSELEHQQPFDLLLNATSLGHQGLAPDIPDHCYSESGFCYDLNYGTAALPWQAVCEQKGMRFSDGLGMLVEQAALAFELWTGHSPDTAPVQEYLRKSSSGRAAK